MLPAAVLLVRLRGYQLHCYSCRATSAVLQCYQLHFLPTGALQGLPGKRKDRDKISILPKKKRAIYKGLSDNTSPSRLILGG